MKISIDIKYIFFVASNGFHYARISRLGQSQKPRNCFSSAPFDPSFVVWDGIPMNQTSDYNRGIIFKAPDGVLRFKFTNAGGFVICQE